MKLIQPKLMTADPEEYNFDEEDYPDFKKRYEKYLFRPTDRQSDDDDLINLRSLYQVVYKGKFEKIPLDYETTLKPSRYTPLGINDIFYANPKENWPYIKITSDGKIAQTIIASSYGLMQLLYTTAVENGMREKEVGLSPLILFDPTENLKYGTKYLVKCINKVNAAQEEIVALDKSIANFFLYFGLGHSGYNRGLKQDVISTRDFGEDYRGYVLDRIKKYEIIFRTKISEGWEQ